MIDRIMKVAGDKALKTDLARLDLSKLPQGITEIRDVSYQGDGLSGHKLDVCLRRDGKIKPVLIDIHGGGFISEDKEMNRLFGNYMASLGFTVFELNVRLAYPEYTVFDQIDDIARGVRYVLDNAGQYECDRDRMYIAGHSSGGVLATCECLMSAVPGMCEDFGQKERDYRYKGLITDCGLMHFYKSSIAYWGMRRMIFPKGYQKDARYSRMVFEKNEDIALLPKVALITNSKDVLRKMTLHFNGVLSARGVEHRLYDRGADGHTGIIFVPYKEENIQTLREISDYLLGE